MFGADPLLRARDTAPLAAERRLTILYDDRPIAATRDDTVTAALLRAGVVATSRSLKYRRPRGPFCLQGDCGTCLMKVVEGLDNLSQPSVLEARVLKEHLAARDTRLACQAQVLGDVTVRPA